MRQPASRMRPPLTPELAIPTRRDRVSVISTVPASDNGRHLGVLLDSKDDCDVSFIVDGEAFSAHRAVLAARSPMFKELLGSMA
nr:unnamed protein product [Digitaria exilis]